MFSSLNGLVRIVSEKQDKVRSFSNRSNIYSRFLAILLYDNSICPLIRSLINFRDNGQIDEVINWYDLNDKIWLNFIKGII